MFEKAAAAEPDPEKSANLLKKAAEALLKSRKFARCLELALKHQEKHSLFRTQVQPYSHRNFMTPHEPAVHVTMADVPGGCSRLLISCVLVHDDMSLQLKGNVILATEPRAQQQGQMS